MKKIMLAILMSVLTLTGCTASSSANGETRTIISPEDFEKPVEITFWHAMNAEQEVALKSLTDQYNSSQDKVIVSLEGQGNYNDLQTKLSAAVSADTVPTMSMGYPNWMVEYDKENFLVDLLPYFEDETVGIDKSNYVDAFLEENNFDGRYLGVPFNKSSEVLYYNKDLLSEAGVTPPKTLDELFATSKTITEKTGIVSTGYDALNNYLAVAIKECGIENWIDDNGKSQIADPCVVKKVEGYQSAIKEGNMRVAGEDKYLSSPFGSGNLAMNIGSTAGATFIESAVDSKFEYGVAPYPGDKVIQQGTNLMVFNSSKTTDEEVSAAWDYIKFLTNDESTTKWAIDSGYLPVTKAAYETTEYQEYMKTSEVAKVAYDQMNNTDAMIPVFEGSNEIFSVDFVDFMSKSLTSDVDVASELEILSKKLEEAYANSK